jgi:hypothetical protein
MTSLVAIEQTRREALQARGRFERTLAAVQRRLHPGNLAEEAWDGVKDKGADMADGALKAVKKRPAAVSVALGAFALFLARAPLKRAARRLISGDGEADGIDSPDAELTKTETNEGVS